MYGSYGSYSSMSSTGAMSIPMDITPSNLRSHDATCAFPSWPRRSSLGESDSQDSSASRPTAFLSDDDLFFCTSNADPFDESAPSSSSSSARSSLEMEREMDLVRERERLQREQFVRAAIMEKERERRRQQQAMRRAQMGHHQHQQPQQQQRRSSPKKSSPKSKLTSIVETKE